MGRVFRADRTESQQEVTQFHKVKRHYKQIKQQNCSLINTNYNEQIAATRERKTQKLPKETICLF